MLLGCLSRIIQNEYTSQSKQYLGTIRLFIDPNSNTKKIHYIRVFNLEMATSLLQDDSMSDKKKKVFVNKG